MLLLQCLAMDAACGAMHIVCSSQYRREICLHKFLNSTSKRLVNLDFNCEKWLLSHTSITFNKVNEKRNSENYRDVIKLMYSMFLQLVVWLFFFYFCSLLSCFKYAYKWSTIHTPAKLVSIRSWIRSLLKRNHCTNMHVNCWCLLKTAWDDEITKYRREIVGEKNENRGD